MVGPLFSLYLNYLPYLRMYVKVTSVESPAVGLTHYQEQKQDSQMRGRA